MASLLRTTEEAHLEAEHRLDRGHECCRVSNTGPPRGCGPRPPRRLHRLLTTASKQWTRFSYASDCDVQTCKRVMCVEHPCWGLTVRDSGDECQHNMVGSASPQRCCTPWKAPEALHVDSAAIPHQVHNG